MVLFTLKGCIEPFQPQEPVTIMNQDNLPTQLLENVNAHPILLLIVLSAIILLSGYVFSKRRKKVIDTPRPKTDHAPPQAREAAEVEDIQQLDQGTWLKRRREGLGKTRTALVSNLQALFSSEKLDEKTLGSLHETLYRSDISAGAVDRLVSQVRMDLKQVSDSEPLWEHIKRSLSDEMVKILDIPFVSPDTKPKFILVIGVNGVGKTTTIGKLAAQYLAENKSVLICAADTFRAAAIDQLQVWGQRLGVKVIAHQEGSDPAAVVFDSVQAAKARGVDVLLIDTAGRLHNKRHLMDELAKITRVIQREIPDAPHESLLVLDATTGQNAMMQVKAFQEITKITGICVTKLDGTAKGGVVIGLADSFRIPIQYIGVGEKASDLQKFAAKDFVQSLLS